jgi:hypothetical protein
VNSRHPRVIPKRKRLAVFRRREALHGARSSIDASAGEAGSEKVTRHEQLTGHAKARTVRSGLSLEVGGGEAAWSLSPAPQR